MYRCFPWMRHCFGSSTRSVEGVPECIQHVTGVRRGMELLQKIHNVNPPPPHLLGYPLKHRVAFNYDKTLVFPQHPKIPQAIRNVGRQFSQHGPLAALSAAQLYQQRCGIIPYITQENDFTVTYFHRSQQQTNTNLTFGLADKTMIDPFALMLTCWLLTYQGYPCVIGSQRLCAAEELLQKFEDMLYFKDSVFGKGSFFFRTSEIKAAHAELSTRRAETEFDTKNIILNYWHRNSSNGERPCLVDSNEKIYKQFTQTSSAYEAIHFDSEDQIGTAPNGRDLNQLVLIKFFGGESFMGSTLLEISRALRVFIKQNPNMRTEWNRFIANWPELSDAYMQTHHISEFLSRLVCENT